MKKFAVLGNPINHSKSPMIHNNFARQLKIKNFYYKKICVPLDNFVITVNNFFFNGGCGLNITAPFKKQAFSISNILTNRAKLSGSVNTIKFVDGVLSGDNTDGIGLLQDLKRLNMINLHDRILVIGSGGAAYGIIHSLLSFGYNITITNRTISHAIDLHNFFYKNTNIKILDFQEINENYKFDLIINTTSASILGKKLFLPEKLFIDEHTKCYDINYLDFGMTSFLIWCKKRKANFLIDGMGMLVCQAAHSFLFWNGILPDYSKVIEIFNKKNISK